MQTEKLLRTPLYENHLRLKARMVPFAGYEMPVQYTGLLEETKTTRATGSLFDVSHMGQFSLKGKEPLKALAPLITNDLSKIKLGQAQYNLLCNPEGGVIDDLIIYYRSENEAYLCVNASNRHTDFEWMREHLPKIGYDFRDLSDETALIAVQGPQAEKLVNLFCSTESLIFYWAKEATILGHPCYLSRTGYTGEDGFEIYIGNAYASELWEALLEKGKTLGVVPAGLGARDTLRTEMGYVLHGHELSPKMPALSGGAGWAIKLTRPDDFIGKQALIAYKENRQGNRLIGFKLNDRRIARPESKLFVGNEEVGIVSSGTMSPHLNAPIALAFLRKDVDLKSQIEVQIRQDRLPIEVCSLPFVTPKTKKA